MTQHLAHIKKNENGEILTAQTVSEHCRKTAEYAAQVMETAGLSAGAYLAALVHDCGKFTAKFQNYLINDAGSRGSVNHTFAGVRLILSRYHKPGEDPENFSDIVSELLALAAGSHHGLFDCVDERRRNGFQHRLSQEKSDYEEAVGNFFCFCAAPEELDRRFQASQEELAPILERICCMTGDDVSKEQYDEETAFYCGLLSRLLLSAVIEGDRRDTAEFMNGTIFPSQKSLPIRKRMWRECLERVEQKLDRFPDKTDLDRARKTISDRARLAAENPGGIVRLNVPTGGGKTLTALRYALAHAQKYGKQCLIFTSPLLSILEQNAAVIREFIQDDSLVLEHHSNLVRTDSDSECLDNRELLTETWEAPIILTTLVQFLNTLFSGKTTAIRRFHSLCNSVIVIDEVQTVPTRMLSLFSLAVNFLAEICGATIVLCSATQPCMERLAHPLHTPIPELVPCSDEFREIFRRTSIENKGELSIEEIAGFAEELLNAHDSLLIVCNKKSEAENLFRRLEHPDRNAFPLSAAMCPAHRKDTLDALKASLSQKNKKTVCVSTQVIEAGVDISFACVIRFAAGMDSVIQAAGRCNRNGEAGPGVHAPVYLISCRKESLKRLPDIQKGKDATLELLCEWERRPEKYQNSLDSDKAVQYYYRALYRRIPKDHTDYPIGADAGGTLFSLLARNESFACEENVTDSFYFRQAFRSAGRRFEVFDQNTCDVIVPYQEGNELIKNLCSSRAEQDPSYLKALLEQAKPYSVSLFQYQIRQLEEEGFLVPLAGGATGLNGHYNKKTGFSLPEQNLEFLEV
ncbi:MAG: CRISPR-associated helicase Cas3' [Lachnospiraceae bacterium]|nr:CRISPR-associated helicase Cas3' [Lachnospiraceae bacterium]